MPRLAPAFIICGLLVGTLGGCAADQRYQQLRAAYDTELSRRQELESQLDGLQEEIRILQERLASSEGGLTGASGTNAELRAQLDRLREEYRALEERLNGIDVAINPETDALLRELAEQFPGVLSYDSRRGMVRFASDLTFALGSTEVQTAGRDALQKLASVLNSGAATAYDLRIVGHTDNVPISAGTAKGHPTNTHLSAHRAIAVRDVLATSGINRDRMEIAGWGEFRPAVPNRTGRGGTPENRRVEIFLLPSGSVSAGSAAPASTPASTPAATFEPVK